MELLASHWICNIVICIVLSGSMLAAGIKPCTVYSKPGDLTIGGIMPFRYSPTSEWCESENGISFWGVRNSEALIWTIEQINAREDILPNITLGYHISDDCRSEDVALWSAMSYFVDNCQDNDQSIRHPSNLIGIIGGSWSSTAIWMAKVVNLFQVPLISFSATSDELSDTVRFPYFFRTTPPDRFQVGAIMDILLRFNWRYIALIYSTDTYGLHGGRQIRSAAEKNDICIALAASIQPYAPTYEVDEVISKLLAVPKVKVVVIFSLGTVAYTFLSAIKSKDLMLNITWIGSDGWGGSSIYESRGLGDIAIGSLFLRVLDRESDRFTRYVAGIDPDTHQGSPWFKAYWRQWKADRNCTSISQCPFSPYHNNALIKGVKAIAHGLDDMLRDSCQRGECYSPHNFTGFELRKYLYNVSFNSTDGLFAFDQYGDSAGKYKIVNLQKNGMEYSIDDVGVWDPRNARSKLNFDMDRLQFFGQSKQPGYSLCREKCSPGSIIVPLEQRCCFGCQACPHNAIVNGSVCKECPNTHWPDDNYTSCNEIIPTAVNWNDPVIVAILILASVGIVCSFFVSTGMYHYRNHPLVKATSRELSAVNVFGLSLAFFDVFAFVALPTTVVCIFAESLLSLFFTITIVPTLLKVVRIYRIFRAGKKSVRRPKFVGIRDQLIMTSLLISMQVGLIVIFSSIYPSKPAMLFRNPPENFIGIYCGLSTSFLVSSIFNLMIIIVCCYYAFLARKVPSNYNESKYIGISVYSTLIITMAAIPVYSTSTSVTSMSATLCTVLLLNAFLGLVCVYFPKLYAILFIGDDVEVNDWRTASLSMNTRNSQIHPNAIAETG